MLPLLRYLILYSACPSKSNNDVHLHMFLMLYKY